MNVWFIILIFIIIIACYGFIYGWSLGMWHPTRRVRLWRMRSKNQNCYNCKHMGHNCECMNYMPKTNRKYNYCTGDYTIVSKSKQIEYIDNVIGTKQCNWESMSSNSKK